MGIDHSNPYVHSTTVLCDTHFFQLLNHLFRCYPLVKEILIWLSLSQQVSCNTEVARLLLGECSAFIVSRTSHDNGPICVHVKLKITLRYVQCESHNFISKSCSIGMCPNLVHVYVHCMYRIWSWFT